MTEFQCPSLISFYIVFETKVYNVILSVVNVDCKCPKGSKNDASVFKIFLSVGGKSLTWSNMPFKS